MSDTDTTTTDPVDGRRLGRRGFFAMGGVAAAGLVLAACGDDDDDTDASGDTDSDTSSTTAAEGDQGAGAAGDAQIAAFAAGLEMLAAETYGKAIEAATAGNLGEVPPAVVEFATTAQAHHQAYAEALTQAAGDQPVEIPADIQEQVNQKFAEVTDVAGLATFAREFERQAADTYLDVIPKLESKAAIDLTGSILPVTRQRVAILNFALGEYPVPETFARPDMSLAPS